jgi:hypothetical protein
MEKPTCETCKFFTKPGFPGALYGVCVRFPQPVNHHQNDWCGEHQPIQISFKEPARKGK